MLAAAAKIATAAVSAIVRQLNFGIWRHRKIICDPRPTWKHPLHVAPTARKRPAHHAAPPADSTALHAARRRAAAHHQNHLLPRISAGPGTVTEATHKSTLNLLARKLRPKMALEDTLWI